MTESIFTNSERSFLASHGISVHHVHDGRSQNKRTREAAAKAAGKDIVLTRVPCRAAGHRLRTRAGHCVQCKPAAIGFIKRETAAQYVYIAGSLSGQLIKIGTCGDINQRERQMRAESYGGQSDWAVLYVIFTENAGAVERSASRHVKGEKVYRKYWKDGFSQMATEMFRCSYSDALAALSKASEVANLTKRLKQYPDDLHP